MTDEPIFRTARLHFHRRMGKARSITWDLGRPYVQSRVRRLRGNRGRLLPSAGWTPGSEHRNPGALARTRGYAIKFPADGEQVNTAATSKTRSKAARRTSAANTSTLRTPWNFAILFIPTESLYAEVLRLLSEPLPLLAISAENALRRGSLVARACSRHRAANRCVVSARRMLVPEGSPPNYQYSSANMMVMTRSVTDGSDGSGE
jgi:hypothetical protein